MEVWAAKKKTKKTQNLTSSAFSNIPAGTSPMKPPMDDGGGGMRGVGVS